MHLTAWRKPGFAGKARRSRTGFLARIRRTMARSPLAGGQAGWPVTVSIFLTRFNPSFSTPVKTTAG